MSTTLSHKFKRFTRETRIELGALLKGDNSIKAISLILNVHESSIYRELKRCKHLSSYDPIIAHEDYLNKRQKCCKQHKAGNEQLLEFIEEKLKEKWSPEIISHKWNEENSDFTISHTTIYNIIYTIKPQWIKYLIHKGKGGNKDKIYHTSVKSHIPHRVDISLRPSEANNRTRLGDIEVDTILPCRGYKSCLAVLVDRKSRYINIVKLKDKSAKEMYKAIIYGLKGMPVKTITYDNGTENVLHHAVNQELNCTSYFCRPYCSSDKGTVENRNKIIRQYYPKGTHFELLTQEEIAIIKSKINNRPLAILDYKTPAQVFQELLQ